LVLLLSFQVALASDCDDYCQDESYDYGSCKETTEEGFCDGNDDDDVFGFEYCEDLERCCCGNDDGSDESTDDNTDDELEGNVVEENSEEGSSCPSYDEWASVCSKSSAELFFWLMLFIVIVLVIANLLSPKKEDLEDEDELNLE